MGLPGSGKTTLSNQLVKDLETLGKSVSWFNADKVRQIFDDWDFSTEGRVRQSLRMNELASTSITDFVICDFVCPLQIMRDNFNADFVVWVDTIKEGRFDDTNKLFENPDKYDLRITEQDCKKYSPLILTHIL